MILFFLILYMMYLYIPTKHALLMYQQNRYRNERYITWLTSYTCKTWKGILTTAVILCICYALFLLPKGHVPQFLLAALMAIYMYVTFKQEQIKEYRKPLKNTNRIQRLWGVLYFLYFIFILALLNITDVWFWIFVTPIMYFTPWFFIMLAGILLLPIEHYIQQYYMNKAQQKLSQYTHLDIIGITGSYGKTSIKNILYEIFHSEKLTLMTPKSYNNKMGITLTIREQLQPLHELFICEMGADHVHEIEALMDFVKPQIGIVSAVGPQHLQTFHTMDAILHEKMQMIEKLDSTGIGFLNADNNYIRSYPLKVACRVIWFGQDFMSDYRVCDIRYSKEGTEFSIVYNKERYHFHTKLLGEHNIMNITCAIAVAHTCNISWKIIQKACERIPYVEHRLEKIDSNSYTILDDAYNANPQGARYALDVLAQMDGRRFLVTPGFIDLGERQEFENYQLGLNIIGCADEVILVGQHQCKSIYKGLLESGFSKENIHIVNQLEQAFHILYEKAKPEDVVLLENDLPDAFNY